jgi:uncharacterized protein YbbC (DUF1343 family)
MRLVCILGFFLTTTSLLAQAPKGPNDTKIAATPQETIDRLVNEAIDAKKVPGVLVRVQQGEKVLLEKSWGNRAVEPAAEPLTLDTIYDLASLTKPIATSTAIAVLVDKGKLKWTDKVVQHWPEFAPNGKDKLTLEHLLLHTSGLIADNPMKDYEGDRAQSLANICKLKLVSPLGEKFRYSDVNFIVLGEIVARVSGKPLDVFCQEAIFGPLGMKDTSFGVKDPEGIKRVAPTQKREGKWMRGEVHDPRAFRLGGVAGHAGLFSTANDLGIYARMILGEGSIENGPKGKTRVLSPKTVREWIQAREVPGGYRTYGFDTDTAYSFNRGELFPAKLSIGHTGFTGTAIWIDPVHNAAEIFLCNRVHPNGKGDVQRLRGLVATEAARLVMPTPLAPKVKTGLQVLMDENFARLKGKTIGIVTNHTGRDTRGRSIVDILYRAPGVKVKTLFSPEHGIRGAVDKPVGDTIDPATDLPVVSLYGPRRKPTKEQLAGLDLVVFDIQDAGCRFYTYSSTLGLLMEAASDAGVGVMVLDRPNPIDGIHMGGPLTDPGAESFVAFHRIPTRHGLTIGELGRLNALERHGPGNKFPQVKLDVVGMEGWNRSMTYDQTGLEWVAPSPNLRSLQAAHFYPGVGLLEFTNLSVGRGTDRPFEWIGAPWMEPHAVIQALYGNSRIHGIRFMATTRTPSSSVFANKPCPGIDIIVEDWSKVDPMELGMGLALALRKVHGDTWQIEKMGKLIVNKEAEDLLRKKSLIRDVLSAFDPGIKEFETRRKKILIYP